jgi:hypothetical protein
MNLILTLTQAKALHAAALAGAMEYRTSVENDPDRTEQAKGNNLAAFDRAMAKLAERIGTESKSVAKK